MNKICRKLQDRLAADGPGALRDEPAAQEHLADCDSCFAFLESLSQVDRGLREMQRLDAPDPLVDSLLARPELQDAVPSHTQAAVDPDRWARVWRGLRFPLQRPLAWGGAAAAILLLAVFLHPVGQDTLSPERFQTGAQAQVAPGLDENRWQAAEAGSATPEDLRKNELAGEDEIEGDELKLDATPEAKSLDAQLEPKGRVGALESEQRSLDSSNFRLDSEINERVEVVGKAPVVDLESTSTSTNFGDEYISDLPAPGRFYENKPSPPAPAQDSDGDGNPNVQGPRDRDFKASVGGVSNAEPLTGQQRSQVDPNSIEELEFVPRIVGEREAAKRKPGSGGVSLPRRIEKSYVAPVYPEAARDENVAARVLVQILVRRDGKVTEATVLQCEPAGLGFEAAAIEAVRQWRFEPAKLSDEPVDVYHTIRVDFAPPGREQSAVTTDDPQELAVRAARTFLDERASLEGLSLQPASGYWANRYVPGDPVLRRLRARLDAYAPTTPRFHEASRRTAQPFDAPHNAALAVHLHADRRGITGESRFLVQVGLQGTQRHGGRRSAMNVALVLDLRGTVRNDDAIAIRALVDALQQAREIGDRFHLVVAGRPGAVVVEPANFRQGYLRVTLDRLLGGEALSDGATPELDEALIAAIERVATTDDAGASLGSSAVILVTSQALGGATARLAGLAHESAVAGVPVSVVAVGSDPDLAELDRITLAGQGNRRLLDVPADAPALVDRELSAASRVVARAVRLRIRLAPGVRLVDVLGSRRLDETRAQAVREAEQSIDLRLSRNLGIAADRGEDEEGIQIVIPAFYAGDSHVVLLDVVAPGPGPIADVTARYKDLVHLRNGVGRASLALGRDPRAAGPLENNVLKNRLAHCLSQTLERASREVAASRFDDAAALLGEVRALMLGLTLEIPGLDNDSDIAADIAMLGDYDSLLQGGTAVLPGQREHLSESLLYAAKLKLLPRPVETPS